MIRRGPRPASVWLGAACVVAVVVALFLAFGGDVPGGSRPFELRALVRSDAQLTVSSPVRVAGVQVGKVRAVEAVTGSDGLAEVAMAIDEHGLPLREGTTLKVRPRLLLEGNFFVDLRPGTGGRELRSGDVLPAAATAGPVQLDRVLSDVTAPVRDDLSATLRGLGRAYGGGGERSAAAALHRALRDTPSALRDTAIVTDAFQGSAPGDLAGVVEGSARTLSALAARQERLAALVTGFDQTMAGFAAQGDPLRRALAELPRTLAAADPALARTRAALPAVRAVSDELRPGLARLPALIDAGTPWIAQAARLVSEEELGGLLADLQPAVADTAAVTAVARPLVARIDELDRCLLHAFLPVSERAVEDPPLTTGTPVWHELLQGLAAVGGAAQNFDGNGAFVRGQTAGGTFPVETSPLPTQGALFGNAVRKPLGTRPAFPGRTPPIRTDAPCGSTPVPSLAAATGVGP